jgi:hypothetical protein
MILQDASGNSFELSIVRYEFATAADSYDRNWLMAQVTAGDGKRKWGGQDPCLLTWEAEELAAWL